MTTMARPCGIVLVLGLLIVGCAPSGAPSAAEGKTIPQGRILNNGVALKSTAENLPPGDPGIQVIFIKLEAEDAGTELVASISDEEEATFELVGAEGRGIPPGKYRVAVILGPEGGTDALKGKFGRENSKIEVEVKPGEDIVIDLAKY